uniref:Secreted protein n=1 Tax=Anopheles maculatus TaxID=74869 RepID=A0A182T3P4_9DIPT
MWMLLLLLLVMLLLLLLLLLMLIACDNHGRSMPTEMIALRANAVCNRQLSPCWRTRHLPTREPISTFGAVPAPCPSVRLPNSCTLFAALMRRIGWEHDFPSAQFASGQPHSSCFTRAVCRAIRCFSISWLTIASTVSAVEISISFAVSGSSSLKTVGKTSSLHQ